MSVIKKSEVRLGNYPYDNCYGVRKRGQFKYKQHSTLHNYNDVPVVTQGHVARASRQARNVHKNDATVLKGDQKMHFTKTEPVKNQYTHPPRVRRANIYDYKCTRATQATNVTTWNHQQHSSHYHRESVPYQQARRKRPWGAKSNKAYRASQNIGGNFYRQYRRPCGGTKYHSQPGSEFNKERGKGNNPQNYRNFRDNQALNFPQNLNHYRQERPQKPVRKPTPHKVQTYPGRGLNLNSQQGRWKHQRSRNEDRGRIYVHMSGLQLHPSNFQKSRPHFQHQQSCGYRRQNPQPVSSKVQGTNAWADFEAFWQHKPQNPRSSANISISPNQVKETGLGPSSVECYRPIGNLGISEVNRAKELPKTRDIYDTKSSRAEDVHSSENLLNHVHITDKKIGDDKSPDNEILMTDSKVKNSAITRSAHAANLQGIFNILLGVNIGLMTRLCNSHQVKMDYYRDEQGDMKAVSDRLNLQCLVSTGAG